MIVRLTNHHGSHLLLDPQIIESNLPHGDCLAGRWKVEGDRGGFSRIGHFAIKGADVETIYGQPQLGEAA